MYPYIGRFTNGETWVEILANKKNAKLINFAYAGATTNNLLIKGDISMFNNKIIVPCLSEQIKDFCNQWNCTINKKCIITFTIGSNDYFKSLEKMKFSFRTIEIILTEICNQLCKFITFILEHTELQIETIIIHKLPPLYLCPFLKNKYIIKNILQYIVKMHNSKFDILISQKLINKYNNINFLFPDTCNFIQSIIANHTEYNIKYIQDNCMHLSSKTKKVKFNENIDQYIFWDKIHITNKIYNIFVKDFLNL